MPRDKWDVGTLVSLARLLRRESPHIVHVHLPFTLSNRYAFIAARSAACPVLLSTEHSASQPWIFRSGHARLIKRLLVALQDSVIVVCDHVRDRLVADANVSPRKFVTVHNGVDVPGEASVHSADGVRHELGIDASTPLVGMVARFHASKRFDDFLKAAQRVSQDLPNAQFVVVGDGEQRYRQALQERVHELNLARRVHFLGFRNDATQVVAALDTLVLATDWEGFPMVTLEAMARETPVVATNLGGLREQILHGETGYLVPPRDVSALAEHVLALLRNPGRAREIACRARRRVEQLFGARQMAEKTQALYLRLIAEKQLAKQPEERPIGVC